MSEHDTSFKSLSAQSAISVLISADWSSQSFCEPSTVRYCVEPILEHANFPKGAVVLVDVAEEVCVVDAELVPVVVADEDTEVVTLLVCEED